VTTDVVPILRVSDASRAVVWYRRMGFEPVFEHRFEPHLPAYVGIRRHAAQIHLSEHVGDANPHGLVYIWVDDVDAVGAEFGVAVDEQPWAREVRLTDPDVNRLRVAEPVAGGVGEGSASVESVEGGRVDHRASQ
jgi:catechol 2,3-dioxygenase-like lactoylglutathione lyase family enzyme